MAIFYRLLSTYYRRRRTHWITDSIGLTRWADFFVSIQLRGAIVSGVKYGTITFIDSLKSLNLNYVNLNNYPNPFNSSTTIEFSIAEPSKIQLVIYNSLGQEVETLMSAFVIPGTYSPIWNAVDLPSGIYYYQLTVGKNREVRKMLYIQ